MSYRKVDFEDRLIYFDLVNFNFCKTVDNSIKKGITEYTTVPRKKLKKLVLLITNNCNMNCRYCIAEQGTYKNNQGQDKVDVEQILTIIDKLIEVYPDGIEYIQFFGGEPLLRYPIMKEFVVRINQLFAIKSVNAPKYSIVTNGTLFNKEIADFVEDNNMYVTVSIDGSKLTNDKNRVYYNEKGTYEDIMRGINFLNPSQMTVEFSVSDAVIENYYPGYIRNIINNYIERGFTYIVFNVICSKQTQLEAERNKEKYQSLLEEYSTFMVDELFNSHCRIYDYSILNLMISILTKKSSRNTCTAGVNSITVTGDGKILTCYLTDKTMCNAGQFSIDTFLKEREKAYRVEAPEACRDCWCQRLCCSWCREILNGNVYDLKCISTQTFIDTMIKELFRYKDIPEKMKQLIQNIKGVSNSD